MAGRKATQSIRAASTSLLCGHDGRCDGPQGCGRSSADRAFIPCLSLAVLFHRVDGHRTKAQRSADVAERSALEAAGWNVLRLREMPLKAEGDSDLPVGKGASTDDCMLALGRHIARQHATGKLDVPAATLARIHAAIRPAPKPKQGSIREPARKKTPAWITDLNGKGVVLLDLDGTTYDSWACCGRDDHKRSAKDCIHVRRDTLAIVNDLCEKEDAVVVVLSWRSGEYGLTMDWLKEVGKAIGFGVHAVLVPDSRAPLPTVVRRRDLWGSVAFKAEIAEALMQRGVRVVGSFDDSPEVCDEMRLLGVPYVHQVPHLVDIPPRKPSGGWVGGHRPTRNSAKNRWSGYDSKGRLFDSPLPAGSHDDWRWDDDMLFSDDPLINPNAAEPQDETDFIERLDAGDAVYGRDYTVDGNGKVVPHFDPAPELSGMHIVGPGDGEDDLADEAAEFLRQCEANGK